MFVWMNGFQNPLAHTHFNMFVDEWTSANESPVVEAGNMYVICNDTFAYSTRLNPYTSRIRFFELDFKIEKHE